MKRIILAVSLLIFVSCNERHETNGEIKGSNGISYNVDVIDGCEYIYLVGSRMAHKGDCSNPIHKN